MDKCLDSFRIAMMIKEIHSSMTNMISHGIKDHGLTYQQLMIIKLIAHEREVTISQLCEEMSLAKGTVSGIVQRLEIAGYIEKVKKEEDKRNTFIRFSDKGLEFAKEFRGVMNESFDDLFSNFSAEEIKQIQEALLLLSRKLQESER